MTCSLSKGSGCEPLDRGVVIDEDDLGGFLPPGQ